MKESLLFLLLTLSFTPGQTQTLAKNDQLKFDADYYMMEEDFSKALNSFLIILKSEPNNADIKFKAGVCYLNSEGEKVKAIPYLEEAAQNISEKYNPNSFKETHAPVETLFLLGSAYRVNNQLDMAIDTYTKYKNSLDPKDEYNRQIIDQYLKSCEVARSMQNNPIIMITANLGRPLNNEIANFNAVVSGDEKTMFYTSPARQGYDIFWSTFEDSAWTTPRNVNSVLSTGKYMKTTDISYDGLSLLLSLDNPINADIFISHFSKDRWTKVEPLGREINGKSMETHASFSPDGKVLYFTSNRKGGEGDMDIYKAELDSKGAWGKAVNLGAVINTPFNEATPFVNSSGDRLFFSSEGHNSMGGYDIFYYDFSNPEKGVVNVGYPLNTTDNDLFYRPVGDGSAGYYAFSGKDSYGGRDIYKVYIEEKAVEEVVADVVPDTAISITPAVEPQLPELNLPIEELPSPPVEELVQTIPEVQTIPVEEPVIVAEEDDIPNTASYSIQIMALKRPIDLTYFSGLQDVRVAFNGDEWYRYTLGRTDDRHIAKSLLSAMILKGYRDAFIRTHDIYPRFTIQVMAVPGPVVDLKRFDNLPEVTVFRGPDNFCRYTTGEFANKEDAVAHLETVKALGYKEAFVTRSDNQLTHPEF